MKHQPKEKIMTTWNRTRRDLRKFLDDVRRNPGKTYYSTRECVQPWGNEFKYREIQFKPSRLWVGTFGHHSAEATLSLYGPLTDECPVHLNPLFESGGKQHRPDAKKVADRAQPKRGMFARR